MHSTWYFKAQVWNTLHSMHKVWHKRVYPNIWSFSGWRPESVLNTLTECETCVQLSFNLIGLSVSPLPILSNIWVNSFVSYFVHTIGVCFILVPWSTMCYASEMGGNLFRHYFDSTVTNILKLRVNSSGRVLYIRDYVDTKGIPFSSVGTCATANSIFCHVFQQKYGCHTWYRMNLDVLTWYSDSPQKMSPDNI